MTEPGVTREPDVPPGGELSPLGVLEFLRNEGAQRLDPVRFHYMEVLSRRMLAHPAEVRRILEGKLKAALSAYGERWRLTRQAATDQVVSLTSQRPELARQLRQLLAAGDYIGVRRLGAQAALSRSHSPLVQLNQHIRAAARADVDERSVGGVSVIGDEMKSLRRFRETWARISAEDEVDQALGRGPENAGPLNAHMLVLRSLGLMRDLSPDYLRRFMSYLDSMLWLDQVNQKSTPVAARPVRRGGLKK